MSLAPIAAEEGVGAEEHRAVLVVEDGGHDPVVERAGIDEDVVTPHQRQHHAGGEAETMEQRHGIEEAVAVEEVALREKLSNVGEEVSVGEFDAFGDAFGTAREEDGGGIGGGVDS